MWWPERWRAFRNRCLANPAFQARALSLPLIRGIARRRARESFDLCAGFVYSQVLFACVRLGVLEALRRKPLTAVALASRVGLDAPAALCLLRAGVPLGLFDPSGATGSFGLGAVGASLLGNPSALAMVAHHDLLYADLADPVALLRRSGGPMRLQRFWAYAADAAPAAVSTEQAAAYSRLMSASQPMVHETVLDVVKLGSCRLLLDVGGGEGAFAIAAARRYPHLHCQVFDLPPVAALARQRVMREGLADRIEVHGGDFLADALPAGADLLSFVRVLHDHDDEVVRQLLRAAHDALPPGGRLLVAEPFAGTASAPRVGDAYFGLYLMAMGQGRPRTAAGYARLLQEAGFRGVRCIPTSLPLACGVLLANRPPRLIVSSS